MSGIWGGKGQGKTFQCNLAYKKLEIAPIVMSAGELESGNAGEPAKLIRQRYREVSALLQLCIPHYMCRPVLFRPMETYQPCLPVHPCAPLSSFTLSGWSYLSPVW